MLLRLPYFWDEGGYYIPAAWDFFRTGTLIPFSTVTNAHPPLPSILLAGWWHLSGFVPSGTRTFICMIAAAACWLSIAWHAVCWAQRPRWPRQCLPASIPSGSLRAHWPMQTSSPLPSPCGDSPSIWNPMRASRNRSRRVPHISILRCGLQFGTNFTQPFSSLWPLCRRRRQSLRLRRWRRTKRSCFCVNVVLLRVYAHMQAG